MSGTLFGWIWIPAWRGILSGPNNLAGNLSTTIAAATATTTGKVMGEHGGGGQS